MSPSHTSGVGEPIGARSGAAVEAVVSDGNNRRRQNKFNLSFSFPNSWVTISPIRWFWSDIFADSSCLRQRSCESFLFPKVWEVQDAFMRNSHITSKILRCIYENVSPHEKFEMHLWEYLLSRNCHEKFEDSSLFWGFSLWESAMNYGSCHLWGYLDDAASPPFYAQPDAIEVSAVGTSW